MGVTQTNQTRNQSTANYESKRIFIFDNRYVVGTFKNTTGAAAEHKAGMLVARSTTVADGFIPVTSSNLADVIGISAYEGTKTLAVNEETSLNICTKGTVESMYLVFPSGVSLTTVVGNKTLRDVLESLGLHLTEGTVEMTDFTP